MVFFTQLLINGFVVGAIYALVALGFVLIYKSSSVINFAQGDFLLIGSFVGLSLMTSLKLPVTVAVIATLVICVILGVAIERVVLRPFIGEPVLSVIMASLGLDYVLRGLSLTLWGPQRRSYPPIFGSTTMRFGELYVEPVYLWSLIISGILLLLFTLFFRYTVTGIAIRAAADDQPAAQSMGISVKVVLAVTWAIAAVVAGIGGILVGPINGVSQALAGIGLKVLPVAILGGLDSIPGAILGGFIIGIVENLAAGYLDPIFKGGVREVAPFVLMTLVLMIRPYGLFGKEIIERV